MSFDDDSDNVPLLADPPVVFRRLQSSGSQGDFRDLSAAASSQDQPAATIPPLAREQHRFVRSLNRWRNTIWTSAASFSRSNLDAGSPKLASQPPLPPSLASSLVLPREAPPSSSRARCCCRTCGGLLGLLLLLFWGGLQLVRSVYPEQARGDAALMPQRKLE